MPTVLLAEIAASLATGGDLAQLLERFLEPVMRLAHAQAGAVRVLSAAGDKLELVGNLGLPPELVNRGTRADRHCGHCGSAADNQAMVWATDLRSCSERSGSSYFGEGCRRLLAVPLQHRGRTLGVYNLFFAADEEPSAEVQQILRSVGELLGLALNNARLEQEHLRTTLMQERQAMAAEVHDSLGQSLAYVKMRMPLLHDAMRSHDDARAQQYYDDVRAAVSQAHASLRSIITHLRVPMDPKGLMHALGASAETFRRLTGIELDFVNELPGLSLLADQETQVFHIVQEALNNVARHARAQHAWLRVLAAGPGAVRFIVEDDGAGLPSAEGGAGTAHYGMEIMAERTRRLGGALEFTERPGGRHPRPPHRGPGRRLPANRPGTRRGPLMAAPRIVLVDDHALCRNGLSDLLRHRGGMEVIAALSEPDQVIATLREHRPDLVVLDLRMPAMDGLTLLRRIRTEGLETPALILTMSDSESDLSAALRAGVRGYLLKDMEPEDVITAIGNAARGELTVAPAMTLKLAQLLQSGNKGSDRRGMLASLTEREREILDHLARGESNKTIARALDISHDTVKLHVRHILSKLNLTSRVEAAVFAVEARSAGVR